VRGAIAANQLRGRLIPIADARKRRDAHGRADDTGPGRGRATALSSALAARMYLVSIASVCAGWGRGNISGRPRPALQMCRVP